MHFRSSRDYYLVKTWFCCLWLVDEHYAFPQDPHDMLIRSEEKYFSVFSSETPRIGVSGAALVRAWHTACASGHAVTTRGTQPALRAREVRPLRGDTMASCLEPASHSSCCRRVYLSDSVLIFRCNILFYVLRNTSMLLVVRSEPERYYSEIWHFSWRPTYILFHRLYSFTNNFPCKIFIYLNTFDSA